MLSICIPVYNFDANDLVKELLQQISLLNSDVEVIVIDDASKTKYSYPSNNNFNYLELKRNKGRAKIRNYFTQIAKYNYLLYLDGDVCVKKKDFLSSYLKLISNETDVLCGGYEVNTPKPEKKYLLRWQYGVKVESKSLDERQKNGFKSFMTANFLIKKQVLIDNPFNESIEGYGHEDTLLGIELNKKGYGIKHLNNPVENQHYETNEEFLKKTEEGIDTLLFLLNNLEYKKDLYQNIHLLKAEKKISENTLLRASINKLKSYQKYTRKILVKNGGSLKVFSLYKLLYFRNKN